MPLHDVDTSDPTMAQAAAIGAGTGGREAGGEAHKRAYVRALLKDIERAAAEALLKEVRP